MSWLKKPNPQQLQEAELLRQWRQSRLEVNLQLLPLQFLLLSQCRHLAAIEEANLERTGCLPVHLRLTRRIARLTRNANAWLVKIPLNWLSRRRCLRWLRPALVRSRRRLVLWFLLRLVKALRRSRSFPGIPPR
ncbi:MAG: hypothetical protein ACLP7I_12095 [Limisphaerales bacterium]